MVQSVSVRHLFLFLNHWVDVTHFAYPLSSWTYRSLPCGYYDNTAVSIHVQVLV